MRLAAALLVACGATSPCRAAAPRALGAARADSIEGLPIRSVGVRTRTIFDPLPGGAFRPLYRLANSLHFKTRENVVRNQLLFAPGDPWSDARARETERALRALRFVEPNEINARRAGDSVDVVVETRDAWSTTPELALRGGGGQVLVSVVLTEWNLLGMGKEVDASYDEEPTRIVRSAGYSDPNLFGSRFQASVSAGTQSDGAFRAANLRLPFYAEDTRHAGALGTERSTSVAHLYQDGVDVANFDRRIETVGAAVAHGARTRLGILREEASFFLLNRRFGPSRVAPEAVATFRGGEENFRERRLAGEARLWRPRYVVKRGVDHIDGTEDLDLGSSVRIVGGWSPRALGATQDAGYAAANLSWGVTPDANSFGWIRGAFSTLLAHGPRETATSVGAFWADQRLPRQTVVVSAEDFGESRGPRDLQAILGGLGGLRGYPVEALAGEHALRLNVEDRVIVGRDILQVVSIGFAGFFDAGRTWGAGTSRSRWLEDIGAGLRLSLPRSSHKRVLRFDVAWPLAPTNDGRGGPVLSFGSDQAF
ncbi:MAG: hypothetical protein ACM3PF_01700 [Bacteroidota bacterium]